MCVYIVSVLAENMQLCLKLKLIDIKWNHCSAKIVCFLKYTSTQTSIFITSTKTTSYGPVEKVIK